MRGSPPVAYYLVVGETAFQQSLQSINYFVTAAKYEASATP